MSSEDFALSVNKGMKPERAACPKCGRPIPIGKLSVEERIVPVAGTVVLFVGRHFNSECVNCGPVRYFSAGHHGTLQRARMSELFPKHERRRIRRVMPRQEARIFRECLDGRRIPSDEQLARWIQIQEEGRTVKPQG